jgi:hypothetical protein
METYSEIKSKHPELIECFFAFSNEQFKEGIQKAGIADKKIYNGGAGLYGTKEGIQKFMSFYDDQTKEIAEKCNPQDVYNYEFNNHECSYTNDDTDAIKIVVSIFGEEKAKTIKRRFGFIAIDDLFKKED